MMNLFNAMNAEPNLTDINNMLVIKIMWVLRQGVLKRVPKGALRQVIKVIIKQELPRILLKGAPRQRIQEQRKGPVVQAY